MNAADGGTRVLIGGGGYCAGVQDNHFGVHGSGGAFHATVEQLTLDGCAIRLGRAASESSAHDKSPRRHYTEHQRGIA